MMKGAPRNATTCMVAAKAKADVTVQPTPCRRSGLLQAAVEHAVRRGSGGVDKMPHPWRPPSQYCSRPPPRRPPALAPLAASRMRLCARGVLVTVYKTETETETKTETETDTDPDPDRQTQTQTQTQTQISAHRCRKLAGTFSQKKNGQTELTGMRQPSETPSSTRQNNSGTMPRCAAAGVSTCTRRQIRTRLLQKSTEICKTAAAAAAAAAAVVAAAQVDRGVFHRQHTPR